jgi:hypothetical protein
MRKMKFFILILFLFCSGNQLFAQLKIGINGGVVLSSLIRESSLVAQDGTVGFLIGANAKYNMGELGWYVQSGIDYTREGDHNQNLSFVKIPLILGLDASDDVSVYVAYNLAWQVGNQNGVQEFYNDFANILGLGFEIHLPKSLSVGSRLNYGLSNLVKDPAEAKNYSVKPFTFEIYLAYRF